MNTNDHQDTPANNNVDDADESHADTPATSGQVRRRDALKTVLAGGTVLSTDVLINGSAGWHKPLIKSVVVPAHAATSIRPNAGGGNAGNNNVAYTFSWDETSV